MPKPVETDPAASQAAAASAATAKTAPASLLGIKPIMSGQQNRGLLVKVGNPPYLMQKYRNLVELSPGFGHPPPKVRSSEIAVEVALHHFRHSIILTNLRPLQLYHAMNILPSASSAFLINALMRGGVDATISSIYGPQYVLFDSDDSDDTSSSSESEGDSDDSLVSSASSIRGCTAKMAKIFLASESHENWRSYQDGVEKE
jgi:hypothetical protein